MGKWLELLGKLALSNRRQIDHDGFQAADDPGHAVLRCAECGTLNWGPRGGLSQGMPTVSASTYWAATVPAVPNVTRTVRFPIGWSPCPVKKLESEDA